jgi:hypothetical protein
MKKIFLFILVTALSAGFAFAGNGNGTSPCNCTSNDQVNIYAAGTAVWVTSYQIRCDGEAGTCWSITYAGKWILTVYTEPPMIFDNHNSQDVPPLSPQEAQRGDGYVIYDYDKSIWKSR